MIVHSAWFFLPFGFNFCIFFIGGPENKTSEAAPHPNRMKKNFASLDCGAKVAGANPEAQSASNIITPSR